MTPLDLAHAKMEVAANDADRLSFYERLVDAELFILLEEEPIDTAIRPLLVEFEDDTYALVFDTSVRMAEFIEAPTPFVALAGRQIISMLYQQEIGVGVNLGVAPSEILLDSDAIEWIAETLETAPTITKQSIVEILPPNNVPESLLFAIDAKLSQMGGLVGLAYLAKVKYDTESEGHVLVFVDPIVSAQNKIAEAISEMLAFSGLDAASIDVLFVQKNDRISAKFARHGLRFDISKDVGNTLSKPKAPGMDPDQPPILR